MAPRQRNAFNMPDDARKWARLVVKGLPLAEIISTLHREDPSHSKQSWRNFPQAERHKEAVEEEVQRILAQREQARRGERSDPILNHSDSSEEELSVRRTRNSWRVASSSSPAADNNNNNTRRSGTVSPTSSGRRRRPRPGKRSRDFQDSDDDDDDEGRDQLASSPQPAQKKTKGTPKPKPKPRASAPAGRLAPLPLDPDTSTAAAHPQAQPAPQRAQSLPPANAPTPSVPDDSVAAEEQDDAQESAPAETFTATQAHRFEADPEDNEPLEEIFSDDDDDDDDDDNYEDGEEEDESGEPATNTTSSQETHHQQKQQKSHKTFTAQTSTPRPSSSKGAATTSSTGAADGFRKDQARAMLQPTKKGTGSRVNWDSPEQQSQKSKEFKSSNKHPMASSSKDKSRRANRIQASSRKQDQVCEPGTNVDELELFTFILDFADRWNLTPVAAHHLAFRCSNDAQIMQLYMRHQRNVGQPLNARELELLEACFWSAKDDRELRPGGRGGEGWDALESRSSIEAMQTRRNFLAMHN